MTRRALIEVTLTCALALGVAGPGSTQPGAGASAEVRVFQFQPGALEVRAGSRVSWTNRDDIAHTVTSGTPGSPDGRFDLRLAGKGAIGSAVLAEPGLYLYFCTRHPSMRGEVVVR